jgi:hypothetical protein
MHKSESNFKACSLYGGARTPPPPTLRMLVSSLIERLERYNPYRCADSFHKRSLHVGNMNSHSSVCTVHKSLKFIAVIAILTTILNMVNMLRRVTMVHTGYHISVVVLMSLPALLLCIV